MQVAEQAELLGRGDFRIDAMQLKQIDAIDAEAAQAHLAFLPEIFGPAEGMPLARASPRQPRLGGDHQIPSDMASASRMSSSRHMAHSCQPCRSDRHPARPLAAERESPRS
jgi:hypothetical protein